MENNKSLSSAFGKANEYSLSRAFKASQNGAGAQNDFPVGKPQVMTFLKPEITEQGEFVAVCKLLPDDAATREAVKRDARQKGVNVPGVVSLKKSDLDNWLEKSNSPSQRKEIELALAAHERRMGNASQKNAAHDTKNPMMNHGIG